MRPRRVGASRKRSPVPCREARPRICGWGSSRSERSTATVTGTRRADGTATVSTAASSSPMYHGPGLAIVPVTPTASATITAPPPLRTGGGGGGGAWHVGGPRGRAVLQRRMIAGGAGEVHDVGARLVRQTDGRPHLPHPLNEAQVAERGEAELVELRHRRLVA